MKMKLLYVKCNDWWYLFHILSFHIFVIIIINYYFDDKIYNI